MKLRLMVVCALLCLPFWSQGQMPESTLKRADSLFGAQNYSLSASLYDQVLAEQSFAHNGEVQYNAAVSYAQLKEAPKAVSWLKKSVANGIDDDYLSELRFDFSFYPIHHTQEWKNFFQSSLQIFEDEAQQIGHPELRIELLGLWQSDQYYRRLIFGRFNGRPVNELSRATEAVDRYNAVRLEQIIETIGWPTHDKVGRDGAHAAWNIIQHAVFNPILMKQSLQMMEEALAKGQVDKIDYAYLYDRFQAVCNMGKIRYGIVNNVPIEDEYELTARREEMGFSQTMAEYRGQYQPKTKAECEAYERKLKSTYETNIALGQTALKSGDYKEANKHYNRAMGCAGYIQTEDIYDSARALSYLDTGRSRFTAMRRVRVLATRGFDDIERLQSDPAFAKLQTDKNWLEVLSIIERYNVDR